MLHPVNENSPKVDRKSNFRYIIQMQKIVLPKLEHSQVTLFTFRRRTCKPHTHA